MPKSKNCNTVLPAFLDRNFLQQQSTASNQSQLFGNVTKRGREEDHLRVPKLPMFSNLGFSREESCQEACIPHGKRVFTSASGGSIAALSNILYPAGDVGMREENLCKGIEDMNQTSTELEKKLCEKDMELEIVKHMNQELQKSIRKSNADRDSVLVTLYEGASKSLELEKKLREKDMELEDLRRMNRELLTSIKMANADGNIWHKRAKRYEKVANALRENLLKAVCYRSREGFGDSEADDAASYTNTNKFPSNSRRASSSERGQNKICVVCKVKMVGMVLMPCNHLCLCMECGELLDFCPLCSSVKNGCIEAHLAGI